MSSEPILCKASLLDYDSWMERQINASGIFIVAKYRNTNCKLFAKDYPANSILSLVFLSCIKNQITKDIHSNGSYYDYVLGRTKTELGQLFANVLRANPVQGWEGLREWLRNEMTILPAIMSHLWNEPTKYYTRNIRIYMETICKCPPTQSCVRLKMASLLSPLPRTVGRSHSGKLDLA